MKLSKNSWHIRYIKYVWGYEWSYFDSKFHYITFLIFNVLFLPLIWVAKLSIWLLFVLVDLSIYLSERKSRNRVAKYDLENPILYAQVSIMKKDSDYTEFMRKIKPEQIRTFLRYVNTRDHKLCYRLMQIHASDVKSKEAKEKILRKNNSIKWTDQ